MGTDAFNGSGSRFNSRFVQGEETYAKQLNDLAAGVQASLPTPYLGGGSVVSYIPGGSIITDLGNPTPVPEAVLHEFKTIVLEQGATAKVQVVNGTAFIAGKGQARSGEGMKEWYLTHFAVFPTGARTIGTDPASPYASQGGYITIANGASGGSDTWFVYLVANNYDNEAPDSAYPMLSVIAQGSDAYTKSRPFSVDDDTRYLATGIRVSTVTMYGPDGLPTGSFFAFDSGGTYLQNYNCQRITVAKLFWNESTSLWEVTQYVQGSVTFTDDLKPGTVATFADGAPFPDPAYASQQADWVGAWSGYTKDLGDQLLPL